MKGRDIFVFSAVVFLFSFINSAQAYQIISWNCNLPIPSPDDPFSEFGKGRMADAIIDVTNHISIIDLDVVVSLTHDSFFDLEIVLESPAGTTITLNPALNNAFIIQDTYGIRSAGGSNRFLFDDEATVSIENATPPFDQAFKPALGFALSAFDGQDAFGSWRLQINDLLYMDTGQLEKVELIVNIPEPATLFLLTLGGLLLRKRRA